MGYGRLQHEWDIKSIEFALFINANRAPDTPPVEPTDINPYRRKIKDDVIHDTKLGFSTLKKLFVKG